MSKVGKGPPTKEAPAAMAVSPPPAPEPVPEPPALPASADHCRIMGLTGCSANTESVFQVEACDENGKRSTSGGDSFFIAIRGASRVRARVSDNKDGTYTVMWKPELSGNYEVAISLFGNAIAGSPFTLHVHDHLPFAPNCEVTGRSLHHITARTNSSFEIIYRDRSGIVCQAVELDVYVMPIGEGEDLYLWKAATQPNWGPEEDISTFREVNAIDLSPQDDKTKKKKKDALEKALEKSEKAEKVEKGEKDKKKGDKTKRTEESEKTEKSPTKLAPAAAEKTEKKEKGDKAEKTERSEKTEKTPTKPAQPAPAGTEKTEKAEKTDSAPKSPKGDKIEKKEKKADKKEATGDKKDPNNAPPPPPMPKTMASSLKSWEARNPLPGFDELEMQSCTSAVALAEQGLQLRQRALRVQVGDKPLIVRAEPALDSKQLGLLLPSHIGVVVEEHIAADGNVRARITFDETALLKLYDYAGSLSPPVIDAGPSIDGSVVGSPRRTSRSPEARIGAQLTGWVTLKKEGRKLVSSRLKLESTNREQYIQQWQRRQLNDKLHRSVQCEVDACTLISDESHVAFAYGGVHPGWLHSKGQVVDKHKVSYSVGKVGRYLLHVRLRNHAAAVPGSPFALTVTPGPAHYSSTVFAPTEKSLTGIVGEDLPNAGITLVMHSSDQMGNACTEGGAIVKTTCVPLGLSEEKAWEIKVLTEVEDLHDGRYRMRYRSKNSGAYQVEVTINGEPVNGSPCTMKLVSSTPLLQKSSLDGPGLKVAVAGERAPFSIRFVDQFGNLANPAGTAFKMGMAVTSELRKKVQDVKEAAFEGVWSAEGTYQIHYIAQVAGNLELHVWCDLNGNKGERMAFPGSPFSVSVSAGTPSASASRVDGWTLEKRASTDKNNNLNKKKSSGEDDAGKIIAGDTVGVRPLIVDSFQNPASKINVDTLTAKVVRPNGSEVVLAVQQEVRQMKGSGSEMVYGVRYETSLSGKHAMHVMLGGVSISGSPVAFEVYASAVDPTLCKLLPPENGSFDSLVADYDKPNEIILRTYDRFGNPCTTGGLNPTGKLMLLKNPVDNTILMPNNHFVNALDRKDGTYAINVGMAFTSTVRLQVNLDKNVQNGDLPPLVLKYTKKE